MKLPLSLCMIVKNEKHFLSKCLDSVSPFVSQIVINDTGSTDGTLDLIKKYNVDLIQNKWEDNFALARNQALEKATEPWILVLDADEVVEQNFFENVKKYIEQDFEGFLVTIINFQSNSELFQTIPHKLLRLFKNHKKHRFSGKIHEQISDSILKNGGKIASTDLIINHFGYQEKSKKKTERNIQILKNQVNENPTDAYTWYQMGVTSYGKSDFDNAKSYFDKSLMYEDATFSDEIMFTIYVKLAQIFFQRSNYHQAEELIQIALQIDINNPFPYYIRAGINFEEQNFQKAVENLHKTKLMNKSLWHVNDYQIQQDLGNAYYKLNQIEKAIEAYSESLKLFPESEIACYNLGNCFYKLRLFEEAKEMYEWAVKYNPNFHAAKMNLDIVSRQLHGV
jgi:tetratricopeptide (TPR) repeat protein